MSAWTDTSLVNSLRSIHSAASAALATAERHRLETKPWGTTVLLLDTPQLSVHALTIARGGFSSLHRHLDKHNYFLVFSGALRVSEHGFAGTPVQMAERFTDSMNHGAMFPCAAGCWHRFLATEPSEVLEVYLARPGFTARDEDIQRHDRNGLMLSCDLGNCRRCRWPLDPIRGCLACGPIGPEAKLGGQSA